MPIIKKLFLLFAVASFLSMGEQVVSAQSGSRIIPQRIAPNRSTGRTSSAQSSSSATRNARSMSSVGLNGFCPVCIIDAKKWVKGNSRISSQFDGMIYYFPNAEVKTKFDTNPSLYVPVMGGYDTVAKKNNNQLVMGSVFAGAVMYKNRVYLFSAKGNKSMFMNSAADFENVDLAFGGMCAVCKAAGTEHPGKNEFRFVYNKMTYLFPSAKELEEFKSNPVKYAQK